MEVQDCIIVGGGPAGLNAAVVLGRCRRKVLLFDTGTHRNRYSHGMHNYLTQDDIQPAAFLQLSLMEVHKYGVQHIRHKVTNARKNEQGFFDVKDEKGKTYRAKKLLIATGLTDKIPVVPGFTEFYGTSVFHCPYCDGWEVKDKEIGVYARNKNGTELALSLRAWSSKITLYTDGRNKLKPAEVETLVANDISIINYPIERLEGENKKITSVLFTSGESSRCEALFFVNGFDQQCDLAETFGCNMTKKGAVLTNRHQETNIEGLYVAGDASKDMHFVVVAAAEGAKAGVIINKALQKELTIEPADTKLTS